jgi:hypothetical protein
MRSFVDRNVVVRLMILIPFYQADQSQVPYSVEMKRDDTCIIKQLYSLFVVPSSPFLYQYKNKLFCQQRKQQQRVWNCSNTNAVRVAAT